ncbi:hypothetical protein WJX74_004414 [Apatococcus lobatus]|uniref:Uncharacterized protein n=2 Tax=Apatococcus TaxID=904362 RepID=A0AAW1RJV2_9CHLO
MMAELQPAVSFRGLQRARTTLEDFVCSYFPLHGLSVHQDLFLYLDVLVYVEGVVYSMDEENERATQAGKASLSGPLQGEQLLISILSQQQLLSDRISAELQQGREYWALERQLCAIMGHPGGNSKLRLDDIQRASWAKSFDYRVLNLLLYQLTHKAVDEGLMDFLRLDEHLVDIGDDLVDYEDDIMANSFNIFRGYVHLYGRDAELRLVEHITSCEEAHQKLLQQLPSSTQEKWQRRKKEASSVPGSEKWSFPQPILDEHAYRQASAGADDDALQDFKRLRQTSPE